MGTCVLRCGMGGRRVLVRLCDVALMPKVVKNDAWLELRARRLKRTAGRAGAIIDARIKEKVSRNQTRRRSGSGWIGEDPSKPGEPPKVLSGRLRRSIGFAVRRASKDVISLSFRARTPYAARLERGPLDSPKGMDRPYMRSTVRENSHVIMAALRRAFR